MSKKPDSQTPAAEPAAPAPAPTPPHPLPVDRWHGVGGEYVIENGVRRRVGGPPLPADGT